MKFKVGDEIIISSNKRVHANFRNKIGVIVKIVDKRFTVRFKQKITHENKTNKEWIGSDANMQLLSIYNSPLMKTLEETDETAY